jgi:hypothetical protein
MTWYICWEIRVGLKHENYFMMAENLVEIRTDYVPNPNTECYSYAKLLGYLLIVRCFQLLESIDAYGLRVCV